MSERSIPQTRAVAVDRGFEAAAWCALAAGGITFWFLVGFPFAHHNESYDWVAWISTPDLASVAWHPFFGAGSYRPLAMSIAWALFRLGDGSLVPIQLFNFVLTVLAWWTLSRAAPDRRTFAVAALVSGGVLFSGYIYLFHLHGVFYGPMLLWLACAVRAAEGEPDQRTQQINLDTYLRHERGDPDPGAVPIILSFGRDDVPGRRLLTLHGRHAGDAIAFLAVPTSEAPADSTPPEP